MLNCNADEALLARQTVFPADKESVDLVAIHKRSQKLAKVGDRFFGARASSPARD